MSASRSLRALAVAASFVLVLGACSSEPSPQYLTDPAEVLAQSAVAMSELETAAFAVEFIAKVDASALMGLGGMGGVGDDAGESNSDAPAAPAMTLNGELTGAVDFANEAVTATFTMPSLMGFTADLRVVDDVTYFRVPMLTGEDWQSQAIDESDTEASPGASVGSLTDPATLTAGIEKLAASEGVTMTLDAPTPCVEGDESETPTLCYTVNMDLDLAALSDAYAPDDTDPTQLEQLDGGEVNIDLRVEVVSMRMLSMSMEIVHPDVESFTATMTFGSFNEPVEIAAPDDAVPMDDSPALDL